MVKLATKRCSKCEENKPASEFHVNRIKPDGLKAWCKMCSLQYHSEWAKRNQSKMKLYNDQYYKSHKIECNDRSREYHQNNKDRLRAIARKRKYNISELQYAQLMVRQEGKCAICKVPADECSSSKGLCVDHDHEKGLIRGLLCNTCNRAIGLLKDDPSILMAAADYLKTKVQTQKPS